MTPTDNAVRVVRSVPGGATAYVTGDITRTQYVDYDRLSLVLELLQENGLTGVIRHSRCGFDYVTGQVAVELGLELYTMDQSPPGSVGLWDPMALTDAAVVVVLPVEADRRCAVAVDEVLVATARSFGLPIFGVGRVKVSWEV